MICVYKNYSSNSSAKELVFCQKEMRAVIDCFIPDEPSLAEFAYRYAEDNYKIDVGYKPFILKGYTIVDEEYKEWQESHNKLNM